MDKVEKSEFGFTNVKNQLYATIIGKHENVMDKSMEKM